MLTKDKQQSYSSKSTSIQLSPGTLPKPYHQINWEKFHNKIVFDYGCGRPETQIKIKEYLGQYLVQYLGYDKFYPSDSLKTISLGEIIICANCICAIKEDEIVQDIITLIVSQGTPFIFKIYEGDKTGIGKQSKKDCWQRNTRTKEYLTLFNWGKKPVRVFKGFIIRKGDEYLLK